MTTSTPALTNARALARLGAYLDGVESQRLTCLARQYQVIAKSAVALLASGRDCPLMLEVVALSPGLQELRSNHGIGLALQVGLVKLPAEFWKALKSGANH